MRSIFAKILLWVAVTTAISLVGFAVTTRLIMELLPGRIDLIARMHALQLEAARSAHDQGGPEGLARYLKRLDALFDAEHALVDAGGRDLADGTDRTDRLSRAPSFPAPPARDGDRLILASPPGGGSRLLIAIHPRSSPAGLLPYYLWIFLVIAALGYALALHLARPLRGLSRAVEQFGRGDLTTRTRSGRRDEVGDLARAFDLMAERIEALMTAQARLLQDVSHELRSPLTRLGLTVRLARSSADPDASLDRIKKEVDRLSALVDELLRVTAAEGDPLARDRESVRLDELLADLIDDGAMEAEAKGCHLDLKAVEPVAVAGDRELIRRAIENVLRNATRHAPEGTAVEMGLARRDGTATITIRDYGVGVPEEALAAIFEPFYRVDGDRSRTGGGVGLGLSISRRAVTLHGGRIVAGDAGPGLRVTIELPGASGAMDVA